MSECPFVVKCWLLYLCQTDAVTRFAVNVGSCVSSDLALWTWPLQLSYCYRITTGVLHTCKYTKQMCMEVQLQRCGGTGADQELTWDSQVWVGQTQFERLFTIPHQTQDLWLKVVSKSISRDKNCRQRACLFLPPSFDVSISHPDCLHFASKFSSLHSLWPTLPMLLHPSNHFSRFQNHFASGVYHSWDAL